MKLLITSLICCLLVILLYQRNEIHKLNQDVKFLTEHAVQTDSLQTVIDSLLPETWNAQRYEIGIDRLKEKDKDAYEEFWKCMKDIE